MNDLQPLTIVVAYRNRSIEIVERFLSSLEQQTCQDFYLVIVDYGSTRDNSKRLSSLIDLYPWATYFFTDTRGHIWNKSKALNIGVRQTLSKYVLTTDIDIIFPQNFVGIVMDNVGSNRVLYCYPYHLPKNFNDWNNLQSYQKNTFGNKRMLGGCMCLETETVKSMRGFDEYYYYWGKEDLDFKYRLETLGVEERWLNTETHIFHQWHPRITAYEDETNISFEIWGDKEIYILENKKLVIRNNDAWGTSISTNERRIFEYFDVDKEQFVDRRNIETLTVTRYNNRAIAAFVRAYWGLSSESLLIMNYGKHLEIDKYKSAVIKAANALLGDNVVRYRPNVLHQFICRLIVQGCTHIADYYFSNQVGGFALLLKQ